MWTKKRGQIFALGVILTIIAASAYAQNTVYKWVDEEGVVHFSESPPDESEAANVEILTTAKSPPYVPPAEPAVKSPATAETDLTDHSAQPVDKTPAPVKTTDITMMSRAELNRRCEEEREKRIAPLRKAEIAKCIKQDGKDPAYCQRFFASYGSAGRTIHGTFRPRMFHDLPECIEAEK